MTEQQFKYYTSQKFVIEPSFWKILQGKVDSIEDLAQETVENGRKLIEKSYFDKTYGKNGEIAYQVYLLGVSNFAWAKKLGAEIENPMES